MARGQVSKDLTKDTMKTKIGTGTMTASDMNAVFGSQTQKAIFEEAIAELTSQGDDIKLTELMLHTILGDSIGSIDSQSKLEEMLESINAELLKRNSKGK